MNQEAILAVLTDSKDDAKSLKEDGPGNQNLCRLDPRREEGLT